MRNYLREEYNRQVRALMEQGYVLSVNHDVASGMHSGEEMRVVLELEDGEYAAVIITAESIWFDDKKALNTFVDMEYKVLTAKWSGVSSRSSLWLNDATEIIEEAVFYSLGYRCPVVPKEEAIAMAKVKEERFNRRHGHDSGVVDLTANEKVREIILRHARKQEGTKRAKDEQIVEITRKMYGYGKQMRRKYQYIIAKANGKKETRYIAV